MEGMKNMDKETARETLTALLSPGDRVYTHVEHVSRSGLTRAISVRLIRNDSPIDITSMVAALLGLPFDRDRWGVRVQGCGMDMTFWLVYQLSRALFPQGHACTGSNGHTPTGKRAKAPRCPSNDHSNGDREYRTGRMHKEGGYALNREPL